YSLDESGEQSETIVVTVPQTTLKIDSGKTMESKSSIVIKNPNLWGPPPTQTPNLYEAETRLFKNGDEIDRYSTRFGIRSLEFDSNQGILVNGELVKIKGVNENH